MKKQLTGALAAAVLASGCATPYSEAPLATNFPTSKQAKLQAAAHWNAIATDMAKQLTASLPNKAPLYVRENDKAGAFERALANQLKTALMTAGHPVMKTPANTLQVEIDAQSVAFSPNRPQYRYAGAATALGAGVWALHDIVAYHSNGPAAGALVALAATDALAWFQSEFASGATPRTEIIVTASVSNSMQYLARSTNVYYVADTDQSLYQPRTAKTFQVRGD